MSSRPAPFTVRILAMTLTIGQIVVPAQLALADRQPPLVANERHVLVDAEASLLGISREHTLAYPHLLDTTYTVPAHNLLLDVNLLFEENLQEELEHSIEINACAANATKFITHNLPNMPSLETVRLGEDDAYRVNRIGWICHANRMDCGTGTSLVENATRAYTDASWTAAINEHCPGAKDTWAGYTQGSCRGYGKLLKMLYTQFPYFGGSPDFKHGHVNLEYWLYQLSTLTKDPGRAGPVGSQSTKPILDYVTPRESMLPTNNSRNLGLGITDGPRDRMSFAKLPFRLQAIIFHEVNSGQTSRNPWWTGLLVRKVPAHGIDTVDNLTHYWDNQLDDSERKKIFGDLLRLPWSFAHMLGHDDPSEAESNVVGVRGNILQTPAKAKELYVLDYADLGPNINWGNGLTQDKVAAADEFERLHKAWYDATRAGFQPIIGGMSGHTLGYLNLYIAALREANKRDQTEGEGYGPLCSLERFRAVMMAGLIGNKRHHSYTEVMSASHDFAYQWGDREEHIERLRHVSRSNYRDLWLSRDPVLLAIANRALARTKHDVNVAREHASVLRLITQWATAHVDGDGVGKNNVRVRSALHDYLDTHETGVAIPAAVNAVETEVTAVLTNG